MKHIPKILLLISMALASCNQTSPIPADQIAWEETMQSQRLWDYAKFIQAYPESRYFDSALTTYFKLQDELWETNQMPIFDCFRNCADIRFMNSGEILFEHSTVKLDSLRNLSFQFILNKNQDFSLPESKRLVIPFTHDTGILNLGVFEILIPQNKLKDPRLRDAIINICAGINDYKTHLAQAWYNLEYSQLPINKKMALDSLNSNRLMLWDFSGEPIPSPPPPPLEPEIIDGVSSNLTSLTEAFGKTPSSSCITEPIQVQTTYTENLQRVVPNRAMKLNTLIADCNLTKTQNWSGRTTEMLVVENEVEYWVQLDKTADTDLLKTINKGDTILLSGQLISQKIHEQLTFFVVQKIEI